MTEYEQRPWNQLAKLWMRYPPGDRIPAELYEYETELRRRVGMPPRSSELCDEISSLTHAIGAGATGDGDPGS